MLPTLYGGSEYGLESDLNLNGSEYGGSEYGVESDLNLNPGMVTP